MKSGTRDENNGQFWHLTRYKIKSQFMSGFEVKLAISNLEKTHHEFTKLNCNKIRCFNFITTRQLRRFSSLIPTVSSVIIIKTSAVSSTWCRTTPSFQEPLSIVILKQTGSSKRRLFCLIQSTSLNKSLSICDHLLERVWSLLMTTNTSTMVFMLSCRLRVNRLRCTTSTLSKEWNVINVFMQEISMIQVSPCSSGPRTWQWHYCRMLRVIRSGKHVRCRWYLWFRQRVGHHLTWGHWTYHRGIQQFWTQQVWCRRTYQEIHGSLDPQTLPSMSSQILSYRFPCILGKYEGSIITMVILLILWLQLQRCNMTSTSGSIKMRIGLSH